MDIERVQQGFLGVQQEKAADLARLAEGFAGAATLSLGEGQVGEFFTRALSAVKNVAEVTIAPSFSEQYELFPRAAEAYFDYQGDGIAARLLHPTAGTVETREAGGGPLGFCV